MYDCFALRHGYYYDISRDMCSNVFLMLPIYMDIGNKYKARGVGESIVVFYYSYYTEK